MRRLQAGHPIRVDDLLIIPVEYTVVERIAGDRPVSIYASKSPLGIVIRSSQSVRAFDVEGRRVSIDGYLNEVEGLRQILDSL